MNGITFQKVSDSEIIISWREPEMTNGLILQYNINVTSYSTGRSIYTTVAATGNELSYTMTGLGEIHCSNLW